MNRLPVIVLGLVFAFGGMGLALSTLRKPKTTGAPLKKSELRAQEAEHTNQIKQRIGGAILVGVGVAIMFLV